MTILGFSWSLQVVLVCQMCCIPKSCLKFEFEMKITMLYALKPEIVFKIIFINSKIKLSKWPALISHCFVFTCYVVLCLTMLYYILHHDLKKMACFLTSNIQVIWKIIKPMLTIFRNFSVLRLPYLFRRYIVSLVLTCARLEVNTIHSWLKQSKWKLWLEWNAHRRPLVSRNEKGAVDKSGSHL